MKFTRTLIAAGILSALGSVATAQEFFLDFDTVNANNLDQFNKKLAETTSSSVTVESNNKSAITIKNDGNYKINGSGKEVTFKFTGTIPENHFAIRFGNTTSATFDNFSNLTFVGDENSGGKKSSWILGDETNFGSNENRIENLTFSNVRFTNWVEDIDYVINVYANTFTYDQDIGVKSNDVTLNFYGKTPDTFGGTQNFKAGLKTNQDQSVTLNAGNLSFGTYNGDDALYVGTGSDLNISTATESQSLIDGNVYIGNSGTLNWKKGGDVTIEGNIRNDGGSLYFGARDGESLKSLTINAPEDADYKYYMGIHSNGSTKINSDSLTVTGGLTIGAGKFDITSSSTVINATGRNAASVSNGAQLIFNAAQEAENQTLVLNSTDAGAALVSSEAKLAVTTGNMSAIGSVQSNGGIIELGTEGAALNTVSIVNNTSGNSTLRSNGGNVSVYADQVLISNEGKTAIDAFTYQREDSKEGDTGLLKIHGNKAVSITGDIVAGKDSNELDRDYVRENSIIEIDSDGLTQIKGNLYTFNSDSYKTGKYDENNPQSGITSGETSNVIKLTLNGSYSSLTGSIVDEGATTETGTSLNLNDGASWNLTGDSTVNTINSDSGFINTDGNQLVADTLTNNEGGTTIETSSGKADQIHINEVEGSGLGIHLTDEATNELDANNPQESLAAVATIENSDSGYSITSEEAGVLGDMQLVMDKDGNVVSFTEKANTVNEGLQDIAASNYLFFRSSMNDVNKRMGDLRTMPKTSGGAWARYYGGEMKYGDMNMETTYNTLQVGADGWIDNFYLGASASISDGNGDLDNGSVDNRNYNFGVYGGWVSDNGQFVDVIVKRHRMETDGKLRSTAGAKNAFDYYNWGTSVSVEYGWRFNCPSTNFWVEPQAELMYGRLDSVDFRTSQGARVSQDAVESLIGRLGASVGYTFDQNRGSAYFKASVLHDWKGETDSDVTANGATRSFHDDLGGTWGEFALGGTYNVTDSFSAYGDVMTTTGSPVRNPWQISVGVRYTF